MHMLCLTRYIFPALIFAALCASDAHAQAAARVYVTANRGTDLNPCTRTSPCRTIQHALDATVVQSEGEVIVLDSGDYDPFIIGSGAPNTTVNSVTVAAAPGIFAGINVPSGTGISINAGSTDVIALRGLTINGLTTGQGGIGYNSGGALHVEHCVLHDFTTFGLAISGGGQIYVKDTLVRNALQGIAIGLSTASAVANITVEHCRLDGNSFAGFNIFSQGQVIATIRDTVASNNAAGPNSGSAYAVQATASAAAHDVTMENCLATGSLFGVFVSAVAGATATVRVSASTITKNATGLRNMGSGGTQIISFGNNRLAGNTTDGSFTSTITLK